MVTKNVNHSSYYLIANKDIMQKFTFASSLCLL
jgi:hypothetical protein